MPIPRVIRRVVLVGLATWGIVNTGCDGTREAELAKAKAEAAAAKAEAAQLKAELAKAKADAKPVASPDLPAQFTDGNLVTPINQLRGYTIDDYRKLPSCLKVLEDCCAVPFDGKTEAQYKSALSEVAQVPCRVVLKLVDVNADYDFATFELLTDDGKSGLAVLAGFGDLNDYNKNLREQFSISHVKAKGLDSKRSIGDQLVLVGLGSIVGAGYWGLYKGLPIGDERYVELRAFGQPDKRNPKQYRFAFMVRNWYIAAQ